MRLLTVLLLSLSLGGASVLSLSCAPASAPVTEGQVATVQRGNLSVDITGVGNLALSQKVDLAFEMDGTVQEVLAQEAQSVAEGALLARLDTSAWQEQVTALEDKVTTAKRNVTAKERGVTQAERGVTDAERKVTQAERGVKDAEQNVTTKKRDLLQAQINVNNAQLSLEQTQEMSTDPLEIQLKQLAVELAKGRLADAERAVEDAATTGITDAQQAVEDARVRVEDARQAVEDARQAVEDATKALDDAREALAEAQVASPEVKAPFAGFITSVNVAGGDEVKKGTVAVTIADPTKFEAEVMVSEKNILKVKQGGMAVVQVEAVPGVDFPAAVTQIAPSATIQSGVVSYKVKVELTSLQALTDQLQPATTATENITSSTFPGRFGQGFGTGNLTQEQLDQIRQQRQSSLAGQAQGEQSQAPQPGGQRIQPGQLGRLGEQRSSASGVATENTQLAEGMTVTVSILTEQKNDVLMVPTQAIISEGNQTMVRVVKDGVTEDRPVQVGISNWQYTEITGGLSEGEQVSVPRATAPTTSPNSTQQQGQTQPGGVVPGLGRILR